MKTLQTSQPSPKAAVNCQRVCSACDVLARLLPRLAPLLGAGSARQPQRPPSRHLAWAWLPPRSAWLTAWLPCPNQMLPGPQVSALSGSCLLTNLAN